MYQLIIFDWDGTIIDSAQKIANCLKQSAMDVGLPVPSDDKAKSIIGLSLHNAMLILFDDISEVHITQMIERYKYHFLTADKTPQSLFKGVEKGLLELEQQGALLAVATGKSRAGLEHVFNDLDMRHYFVTSRCADETHSKPHPQMLHDILDFTAIDPTKAIMVGDTTYDVEMAVNANIDVLGVSYGVHSTKELNQAGAKVVLDSFKDMIDWLLDGRVSKAHG